MTVELRQILNRVPIIPPADIVARDFALKEAMLAELKGINEKLCEAFDIVEDQSNQPK